MRVVLVFFLLVAACADLKSRPPTPEEQPKPTATTEPNDPAPVTPPPVPAAPSDDGGSAEAATPTAANVDTICDAYCDWRDRCPPTASWSHAECLSGCRREWSGRAPHLRPNYVTSVGACFKALTCSKTDDACFNNYFAADPDPADVPAVKACLDAKTDCGNALPSDACYAISTQDDATRALSANCVIGTCEQINSCLRTARGD